MLFYDFQNYEEFKHVFNARTMGNGKRAMNKILFSLYKDKENFRALVAWRMGNSDTSFRPWSVYRSLEDVMSATFRALDCYAMRPINDYGVRRHRFMLLDDFALYHPEKNSDSAHGVCEDGAIGYIRYENTDGHVFKVKAGKFFKECFEHFVTEHPRFGMLTPHVKTWLTEQFCEKWATHVERLNDRYELHVDDNFNDIYDSYYCEGDFGSCMTDGDRGDFYRYAVNAQAAYLTDSMNNDKIVARCIIFMDAIDQDGKHWRLAERQYATDKDDILKRLLVDRLIRGGYIDGYKKVGVDCHNNRAYMDTKDNSIADRMFHISCNLYCGDTMSYQDTFVYYDYNRKIAYNWHAGGSAELLNDTCSYFEPSNLQWSEYYETYLDIDSDDVVYVENRDEYYLREDCLRLATGDYVFMEDDDLYRCQRCGEYYLLSNGNYYSELTEEDYCCASCMRDAEQEYKRDNWYYAEFDDEYYEDEDDVVPVFVWNVYRNEYIPTTIYVDTFDDAIERLSAVEYNGQRYIGGLVDMGGYLLPMCEMPTDEVRDEICAEIA